MHLTIYEQPSRPRLLDVCSFIMNQQHRPIIPTVPIPSIGEQIVAPRQELNSKLLQDTLC